MMELEHISIFKELLRRHIHPINGDILQTLNREVIRKIGDILEVDNIRIYLFSISGRNIQERQVIGDNRVWAIVEIEKVLAKNKTEYENLNFTKIQYSNDDGRLVTIGFLGIYRQEKLDSNELALLELLCMLYGDYVRRKISLTINLKIRTQFQTIINLANKGGLAGTIIKKCLGSFHKSLNVFASYYCVIDKNDLYIDYIKLSNTGNAYFSNTKAILISNELLKSFQKRYVVHRGEDSQLDSIYSYLSEHDKRLTPDFLFFMYPAKNNDDIIGCWLFLFSPRQFFDNDEIYNFIEFANPLIQNNYKYLFQRKTMKMIVDPIFKNRDTRIKKEKIFVLMPFTLDWSTRIWQQMIKPVIEFAGFEAIRADDLFGNDIMEDIWSSILSANLIIADITGRNPNVFYELGIAHALGKTVILITQNKDDIPFDLNRYRHIIYQDNFDGYEILKKKLQGAIEDLTK